MAATLRVILTLLAISTIQAIGFALLRREAFQERFPQAIGPAYVGLILLGLMGLVSIIGMWRWRRWGVVLFAAVGLGTLVLDEVARAPVAHKVACLIAPCLVLALAWRLRDRWR